MAVQKYQSALTGAQVDAALLDMAEHNSEAFAVGERAGTPVGASDPAYHNNSKYYSEQAAAVANSRPYIGENGNWYEWDNATGQFVDTGIQAQGQDGNPGEKGEPGVSVSVGTTTTGEAGTEASVKNSGTDSDPILNFTIPRGENASIVTAKYGTSASESVVPTSWAEAIPVVQAGNFLWTRYEWNDGSYTYQLSKYGVDGAGSGDMKESVYDQSGEVADAGGIVPYVEANGGKIDAIKLNGTPISIIDKTVDIVLPIYDGGAIDG